MAQPVRGLAPSAQDQALAHPRGSSRQSIMTVPGHLTPSFDIACTRHAQSTHTHMQKEKKTLVHINIKRNEEKLTT